MLLLPSDPSTWSPLPLERAVRTVTSLGLVYRLPSLPDGAAWSLEDWKRELHAATGPLAPARVLLHRASPDPDQRRSTGSDDHARGADERLLKRAQAPLDALGLDALLEILGQGCSGEGLCKAAKAVVQQHLTGPGKPDAERDLVSQEIALALLLAAGAPLDAELVRDATRQPNQALTLRLLRAWPAGQEPQAFALTDRGGYPTTLLNEFLDGPAYPNRAQVLDALLEAGHPLDLGPNNPRQQPLSLTALNNRVKDAERLLQAGADVNAPDRNGDRPLYWALMGKPDLVALFLAAGADPHRLGHLITPVEVVIRHVNPDSLRVLEMLAARDLETPPVDQPLMPPAAEHEALVMLNDWARSPGLTEDQQACKNWLEARDLNREVVLNDAPSVPRRPRL